MTITSAALFDRPIVVIGCNRSGTTLLFRNLAEHPITWSLYEESQHLFYNHYPVHPERGDSIVEAPTEAVLDELRWSFYRRAHNKERFSDTPMLRRIPRKVIQRPLGRLYKRAPLRLVEKTPSNCFRIPFLNGLFPDARFVFLVRRPESVISSLMEGWKRWSRTGMGEWKFGKWHYLAPPGWRTMIERPLPEICCFQWTESNRIARDALARCCRGRSMLVRHEDAISDPRRTYAQILEFCELPRSPFFLRLVEGLENRVFTHRGSNPRPEKWKELHYDEVESVRDRFQSLLEELYPG